MDITRPPLPEQAGPPMDELFSRHVAPAELIEKVMENHPDASPDEVTKLLRRQGHDISGVWVAEHMRRRSSSR